MNGTVDEVMSHGEDFVRIKMAEIGLGEVEPCALGNTRTRQGNVPATLAWFRQCGRTRELSLIHI